MGKRRKKKVIVGEHGQRMEVKQGVKPYHIFFILILIALFSLVVYKGYDLYLSYQENQEQRTKSSEFYEKKKEEQGKF